jgi:hypothetical protein
MRNLDEVAGPLTMQLRAYGDGVEQRLLRFLRAR